jgi:hypothetical protein
MCVARSVTSRDFEELIRWVTEEFVMEIAGMASWANDFKSSG